MAVTIYSQDEVKRALDERRIRESWGGFLGSRRWDRFVTLTTREATSCGAIVKQFDRFVRAIERVSQRRADWALAVEEVPSAFPHIHALLAGTATITVDRLQGMWSGHSRMVVYDSRLGAAYYLMKSLHKGGQLIWYDVSKRLPPPLAITARRSMTPGCR